MLDKDTFINHMNEIIEQYDTIEELDKCFYDMFGGSKGKISEIMSVSLPIKILADAMNDSDDWIDYYVYECDCGRTIREILIDDEKVKFETVEDLWNILNNHKRLNVSGG